MCFTGCRRLSTTCDTTNSLYSLLTYSTNLLHPSRFLLLRPACPRLAPSTQPASSTSTTPLRHWILCSLSPLHPHYSHSTDLPQPLRQTDGDQKRPRRRGPLIRRPPTVLRKQRGGRGQKGRRRQGAAGQKTPEFQRPVKRVREFVTFLSPWSAQLSRPHQVSQPVLPDLLLDTRVRQPSLCWVTMSASFQ